MPFVEFPFNFPFEPYSIQTRFMEDMQRCLDSGAVGIFESPTGTGKTLSLICGSLTWLIQQRNWASEELKKINEEISYEQENPETDWISQNETIYSLKRKRQEFEDSLSKIQKIKSKSFTKSETSPEDSKLSILRVFYCSRTHSQLSQLIREFQKTEFSKKIRLVTLGSRQQLCINEDLSNSSFSDSLNRKCHDLIKKSGCPYYKSQKFDFLCDSVMSRPMNIEDLVSQGRENQSCPFYAAKTCVDYAELVVVPYSVIFHEKTRMAYNLEITDHVVLVDEAHNLMDSISSLYNATLSRATLLSYSQALSNYISRYNERFSAANLLSLKKLTFFVNHVLSFLEKEDLKECVFTMNDFFFSAGLLTLKPNELVSFMERSMVSQKIKSRNDDTCYESVDRFLDSISYYDSYEDARIVVIPKVSLKYSLFNPSSRLIDLANKTRSLVLVGGTMRPCDDVIDVVTTFVDKPLVEHYSGHVCDPGNSLLLTLPVGPSKIELKLNYAAQSDPLKTREVCRTLINLARVVPRGGIVCFFPSYEFENRCHEIMRSEFSDFLTKKRILFREPKNSNQVDQVLQEYSSVVSSTCSGLLFCVIGGKLSEGINFKDDMCRLVVVVGVPFPNIKSPDWIARVGYLNKNVGDDYSRTVCMRTVNQSIGRAIRHRDDFAVVVLLDQRYGSNYLFNCLPDWLRRNSCVLDAFPKALMRIRNFFVNRTISY